MDIKLRKVTIRELTAGYQDNQEAGVVGFSGELNIRPPYQREFVYKDSQRDAVITTVFSRYPLNTMYWAVTPSGFEVIDGQQRTVSICQYVSGAFSYKNRFFHNLQQDEIDAFLSYELSIYQCSGTDSEKLEWFRTINIAGEKLTDQELRNAVYSGPWTADAKRHFSKSQCPAWRIAEKYMNGSSIRQEYLETAISWINDGDIEGYMSIHQHDTSANQLWLYFQKVISWVEASFPNYRKEMKGIEWGRLYNTHKDDNLDPAKLEQQIYSLMADDEVTKKKGAYEFVLTGEEKHLSLRVFSDTQKRTMFERQGGICMFCEDPFSLAEMDGDHVIPWSKGGKTDLSNGQMLCRKCNLKKSNK